MDLNLEDYELSFNPSLGDVCELVLNGEDGEKVTVYMDAELAADLHQALGTALESDNSDDD